MKTFGKKKERTALENLEAQEKLIQELKACSPLKKKKGIVLKFKTCEEIQIFAIERYTKYYE